MKNCSNCACSQCQRYGRSDSVCNKHIYKKTKDVANKYIVAVDYWPVVMGKGEIFKVQTKLTKEEIKAKVLEEKEKEDGNEWFEIYVKVKTVDEYLDYIPTKEIK